MADAILLNKVQDLSDLELATLICLAAQEHCIIDTDPEVLDDLVQELQLVSSQTFGLSHAIIDCSEHTTLDDFAHAIVSVEGSPTRSPSPVRTRTDYFLPTIAFTSVKGSPVSESFADNKSIAGVIIAKNIDEAPKQVQIQALELMRTGRIYTRTSVQSVPKRFLFICLLAGGEGPRLTKHLNDYMFISHFHDPEDGFPNLEEMYDDGNSISSVVKKSPKLTPDELMKPRISAADIEALTKLSNQTTMSLEVKQYQMNIVSFLRVHRAVFSGISAVATKHFDKLAKCMAPLQGITYVTPSLVCMAARKIYPHRIHIVKAEQDRSMQWGSDLGAVTTLLEGISADDVVEDVLGTAGAEAPL